MRTECSHTCPSRSLREDPEVDPLVAAVADTLTERGLHSEIAHKGEKAPIQATRRWTSNGRTPGTTASTACTGCRPSTSPKPPTAAGPGCGSTNCGAQLAQRCRALEWLGVEHAIVLCAGLWAAAGLATLAAARPLLDRAERAG
jgi:hypothetical protein